MEAEAVYSSLRISAQCFFLWNLEDGLSHTITVTFYMSHDIPKLQPQHYEQQDKFLTASFYLLRPEEEAWDGEATYPETTNEGRGCACGRKGSWLQTALKCSQ